MKNIVLNISKGISICQFSRLTASKFLRYALSAFAKSKAEPQNSNDLYTANNNTPPACFLVCCTRTPKENALSVLLSMVTCNGKGSALCCVPCIAVSEPVTRYRPQASELQAVTSKRYLHGVTQMFTYLFAGIVRTDLTNKIHYLRISAPSEMVARAQLAKTYVLVFAGRIAHAPLAEVNHV